MNHEISLKRIVKYRAKSEISLLKVLKKELKEGTRY